MLEGTFENFEILSFLISFVFLFYVAYFFQLCFLKYFNDGLQHFPGEIYKF